MHRRTLLYLLATIPLLPSRLAKAEILELTDQTFYPTIDIPAAAVVAFYDSENIQPESLFISPDKRLRYELLPQLQQANKYARPGDFPITFAAYDLAQRGEIPQIVGVEHLTVAFFDPGTPKHYSLMPPMIDNARGHLEYKKELERRIQLLKE